MAGLNLDTLKKVAGAVSSAVSQNASSGSAAQSANAANSMPADYTGSAKSVYTFTNDQDAIRAQMNANSIAWYGASAEEQERLHQENQYLAAQLGGSVSYDPGTGAWSGVADLPDTKTAQTQVEDYSSYLEQMYAAQKAKTLAELDAAYQKNINAIDRAGEGVEEQYQTARSSTAGASELAKRNFAEYAAANGLNSGTGGQAELARNVTLQNNLNSIDTQEARTVADLELQRANAETEYNNAIAQAEATGDYELASALYQEKVRVQELLLQQEYQQRQYELQQYQMNYQAQRDQVADSQWQQSFGLQQQQYSNSLSQSQQSTLAAYGKAWLEMGLTPSAEMLSAMGITEQDAQNYIAALQAQKAVSAGSGSSGSSGSSGGSGTPDSATDYNGLFAAAQASGYPRSFIANYYKKYGFTSSIGLYDAYQVWERSMESAAGYNDAYFTAMAKSIAAALEQGKTDTVTAGLDGVWSKLSQTQQQTIQELLGRYGLQYPEG